MKPFLKTSIFAVCLLAGVWLPAGAAPSGPLAEKAVSHPSLDISVSPKRAEEIRGFQRAAAWDRFQARHSVNRSLHGLFDERTGRPAIIELSEPWIPGAGNALAVEEVAGFSKEPVLSVLERLARGFVKENQDLLGIAEGDLVLNRVASQGTRPVKVGEETTFQLWHLVFDWAPSGVAVEQARLVLRVSQGNLIQIETLNIADRQAVPRGPGPVFRDAAREVLGQHVGGFEKSDRFAGEGVLRIVPVATEADAKRTEPYAGPEGKGLAYRAVWVFDFERAGEPWQAAVDSVTGEVMWVGTTAVEAFASGKVRVNGGPTGEVNVPFPYVDYKEDPAEYAGHDGFYLWFSPSISHLAGRFAKIQDTCGAVNVSGPGSDLAFGGAATPGATNCNSIGGGSGNTTAARTAYYHVTQGKSIVQGYLPGLPWLDAQLDVRTNLSADCVALYREATQSAPDRLEFHRSNAICRNNGELESHILHEFGHGVDYNDGINPRPDGGSGEGYADIVAFLITRDSCIGRGLDVAASPPICGRTCTTTTTCRSDYTCVGCDGFRDVDWTRHATPVVHTPETNLGCLPLDASSNWKGPCGRQPHCETAPATEAVWDLVGELIGAGMSENDAWQKTAELFLSSRPSGGSMFTCAFATTSRQGGAASGSLYYTLRAADDCDGDPSDGTPNAPAIFAALDRHQIAVGAATDAMNQHDPCDTRPVADFTFTCTGRTCNFNGGASTDDVGVASWSWSFGDGTPVVTENDPVITHTFATSNFYNVTLAVRDTLNQPGSDRTRLVLANEPPVAGFTFNCTGLACSFDGSASTDDNGIALRAWNFGDGGTASGATASRTFAAPGSYTVTFTVTDNLGTQTVKSRLVTVTNEATPTPASYFTVPPCRLLDTRTGAILSNAVPRVIQVTGLCGIPASAKAVSLNVTAVSPTGNGRFTFYPGDQAATGATSTLNFTQASAPRANNAILRLATNGTGTLGVNPAVFSSPGQVHLILDVQGYFSGDATPAAGAQGPFGFQAVPLCRLADTRPSSPLLAGTTRTFPVQNVCGIPSGTPAASLNLTVTDSIGAGHLILFPSNIAVPGVSAINFNSGTAVLRNGARVNLAPATPDVALHFGAAAGSTVHAILDTNGYFKAGAPYQLRPITPCRVVDTRQESQGAPALVSGGPRSFQIRGNCGIPSRAKAAFVNVIAVAPTSSGHLTAWAAGTAQPAVPNHSFDAGEPAIGNGMIVPLGSAADDLAIVASLPSGNVQVVVDVFGWFDDPAPVASFTVNCANRVCTFNGTGSTDNVGITSWTWSFGDGTPAGAGSTVSHTYAASGSYNVTLTVQDTAGQPGTKTLPVLAHLPPTACFAASCTGLNCTFNGGCSTDDLNSLTYSWAFGDATSGSGVTPTHSYPGAGTYPVTLTVTDNGGLTSSTTQNLAVTGPVPMGEAGTASLGLNQITINLSRTYTNPVVFAQPLSMEGGWDPPAVARVFDVQSNRFTVKLDSLWNPPNPNFAWEAVHWMVLEAGSWELEGLPGVRMEVGKLNTAATVGTRVNPNSWARINFTGPFGQTPVVLTQTQTRNDAYWVKTRQRNPSTTGVDVALESAEIESRQHGSETVGWLAVRPTTGRWSNRNVSADRLTGSSGVTDQWSWVGFGDICAVWSSPVFLASLSSTNELNGHLRYKGLVKTTCQTRAELMVQTDTTWTPGTTHTREDVDRFAIDWAAGPLRGVRLNP